MQRLTESKSGADEALLHIRQEGMSGLNFLNHKLLHGARFDVLRQHFSTADLKE